MEEKVKKIIGSLVDKKHVYLFKSRDDAIRHFTGLFKYKTFLIQDQCSIDSYKGAESYMEVRTNYGIIDLKDLIKKCQNKILILDGMSNYFAEQPMDEIMEACKGKNCFVSNDVSGGIGLSSARQGDYALCNFGNHDVINLGYGGFLASNTEIKVSESFDNGRLTELHSKLEDLDNRLKYLYWINSKVKSDLNSFNILHKKTRGINVMVKCDNENEKKRILKYCEKNQLGFAINPKCIKMGHDIIAIEINKK